MGLGVHLDTVKPATSSAPGSGVAPLAGIVVGFPLQVPIYWCSREGEGWWWSVGENGGRAAGHPNQ